MSTTLSHAGPASDAPAETIARSMRRSAPALLLLSGVTGLIALLTGVGLVGLVIGGLLSSATVLFALTGLAQALASMTLLHASIRSFAAQPDIESLGRAAAARGLAWLCLCLVAFVWLSGTTYQVVAAGLLTSAIGPS